MLDDELDVKLELDEFKSTDSDCEEDDSSSYDVPELEQELINKDANKTNEQIYALCEIIFSAS